MDFSRHTFLFTITDRFHISGRGIVVVPGIPWNFPISISKGEALILRTPLGDIIPTVLFDIELITRRIDGEPIKARPLLLREIRHLFDIPIGTEVWLDRSPMTSDPP